MTSPNTPSGPTPYPPPGQLPPLHFPPPMYFPPPMPRERGGFARAIFTTLAVSILGFSITLNIYLLVAQGLFSSDSAGGAIQRQTITPGDLQNVIAVVPVEGMIWGQSADDLDNVLKEIEKDAGVKAVVLEVNSPGGEVSASDQMYARLLRFKQEKNVPLVISMQALAASGGYYIACAGDHIVAQQTTATGSIGVLWGGLNVAKLFEKYGVEDKTLVSSGATLKLAGSPYRQTTPQETAYMQKLIDTEFELFKSVVAQGRKLDTTTVDQLATGQIYLGPEAKNLKLVDDIGFLADAVQIAGQKAGLSKPHVVRFKRQPSFWEALSGRSAQAQVVQAKIGDMTINVDQRMLNQFISPKPMFLYRGQ